MQGLLVGSEGNQLEAEIEGPRIGSIPHHFSYQRFNSFVGMKNEKVQFPVSPSKGLANSLSVRKSTSQGEEDSKTRVCVECPDDLHLFRISFWPDFIFSLLDAQDRTR